MQEGSPAHGRAAMRRAGGGWGGQLSYDFDVRLRGPLGPPGSSSTGRVDAKKERKGVVDWSGPVVRLAICISIACARLMKGWS